MALNIEIEEVIVLQGNGSFGLWQNRSLEKVLERHNSAGRRFLSSTKVNDNDSDSALKRHIPLYLLGVQGSS
jgi:hypothetical protein